MKRYISIVLFSLLTIFNLSFATESTFNKKTFINNNSNLFSEAQSFVKIVNVSSGLNVSGVLRNEDKTMSLISYTILTDSANVINFTGLDGNNDKEYELVCESDVNYNDVSSFNIFLNFNNDYGLNYRSATGTTLVSNSLYFSTSSIKISQTGDNVTSFKIQILTANGVERYLFCKSISTILHSNPLFNNYTTLKVKGIYKNKTDNITSIQLYISHPDAKFNVGSRFYLYARR